MEYREQNNYPKAFALTAVIMGALVALCFLLTFTIPAKPIEGTGGILVNYGTTDKGMGDDYMSAEEISRAEKANKTAPNKVTPTPNSEKASNDVGDKKVVTQTTEDAPVVADNSKKATNTVATTDTKKPESKPVINQNALYKGAKTTGTGAGDGNTNTPGNQGKVNGSTLSDNYNGTGSGNGGLAMAQRSFVTRPTVDNPKRTIGIVKVDVDVDKSGNVIRASPGRGTTIVDNALVQKCVQAVYGVKVNASELAPDTQTGTVTFVFKVN